MRLGSILTRLALHAGLLLSYAGISLFMLGSIALAQEERVIAAGAYEYSVELVKDILPGEDSSLLSNFINYKGKVYFTAFTEGYEYALWETDGTTYGTKVVKPHIAFDFEQFQEYYGENFWYYAQITSEARYYYKKYVSNDKMYFRAPSEDHGEEVWVSDGTTDGTNMLKDIVVGPESTGFGSYRDFVPFDGKTYFVASDVLDYPTNYEIWVTDGSENGTHILKDITPDGSSFPRALVPLSDRLLFRTSEYELWYTDGSKDHAVKQEGFSFDTLRVEDISDPSDDQVFLHVVNVSAYYGDELWITEGVNHVPKFLKAFHDSTDIKFLDDLKFANGKVPFVTRSWDYSNEEDKSFRELWATDGTVGGTVMLSKFNYPYLHLGSFAHFGSLNRTTFIAENNVTQGPELWETDGTPEGTQLFKEFYAGSEGVTSAIVNRIGESTTYVPENGFMLYYLNGASDPEGDPTGQNNTGWSLWVSDGSFDGTISLNFTSRIPIVHELSAMGMAMLSEDVTVFEAAADGLGAELWKVTRRLKPPPCEDSSIRFKVVKDGRKIARDCMWVKTRATKSRCKLDGVKAICAKTCGTCTSLCTDSSTRLRVLKADGKKVFRDCIWVKNKATKFRCKLPGMDNACRRTCGKCRVTESPSSMPTSSPSSSVWPTNPPSTAPSSLPTLSLLPTKALSLVPTSPPSVEPSSPPSPSPTSSFLPTISSMPTFVESRSLALGDIHTCALDKMRNVKCWGYNGYGQLGIGNLVDEYTPVTVSLGTDGSNVMYIASGRFYSCLVNSLDNVKCWGDNIFGSLGLGEGYEKSTPTQVTLQIDNSDQGSRATQLALDSGGRHSCVIDNANKMKCWGLNNVGQLGIGSSIDQFIPMIVSLSDAHSSYAIDIGVGGYHTCVVDSSTNVQCWGWNVFGQLGISGGTRYTPTLVSINTEDSYPTQIELGYGHSCVITNINNLICWGWNGYGQLGNGSSYGGYTPTPVSLGTDGSFVTKISLGEGHTCAIDNFKNLKCWGDNQYGQLGTGSFTNEYTPTVVSLGGGEEEEEGSYPTYIAVGGYHSCAVDSMGNFKCWGRNDWGQLGIGSTENKNTPTFVFNDA